MGTWLDHCMTIKVDVSSNRVEIPQKTKDKQQEEAAMKALSGSAVMLMVPMLAGVALAETINFHNLSVGPASPPGWNCTQTGEGDVKWSCAR